MLLKPYKSNENHSNVLAPSGGLNFLHAALGKFY